MAVRVLPVECRPRYAEEFTGELYYLAEQQLPRRRQLAHVMRLAARAWMLRRELRAARAPAAAREW